MSRLEYSTGTLDWNTVTFDLQVIHLQLYLCNNTQRTIKSLKYTLRKNTVEAEKEG